MRLRKLNLSLYMLRTLIHILRCTTETKPESTPSCAPPPRTRNQTLRECHCHVSNVVDKVTSHPHATHQCRRPCRLHRNKPMTTAGVLLINDGWDDVPAPVPSSARPSLLRPPLCPFECWQQDPPGTRRMTMNGDRGAPRTRQKVLTLPMLHDQATIVLPSKPPPHPSISVSLPLRLTVHATMSPPVWTSMHSNRGIRSARVETHHQRHRRHTNNAATPIMTQTETFRNMIQCVQTILPQRAPPSPLRACTSGWSISSEP